MTSVPSAAGLQHAVEFLQWAAKHVTSLMGGVAALSAC